MNKKQMTEQMKIFLNIAWFLSLPLGLFLVIAHSSWLGLLLLAFWAGGEKSISTPQLIVVLSPALYLAWYADFKGVEALPFILIGIGSGFTVLTARAVWLSLFPASD